MWAACQYASRTGCRNPELPSPTGCTQYPCPGRVTLQKEKFPSVVHSSLAAFPSPPTCVLPPQPSQQANGVAVATTRPQHVGPHGEIRPSWCVPLSPLSSILLQLSSSPSMCSTSAWTRRLRCFSLSSPRPPRVLLVVYGVPPSCPLPPGPSNRA
jgi:hypothetical protein